MTAFLTRMPAGIPGDITRKQGAVVEPQVIDSSVPPTVYGNPVKITAGKVRPIVLNDAATDIYGILVRPFPTNAGQDGLGVSTPPTSGPCDVMKSGYINVKLNGNRSAVKNGTVYVRVGTSSDPTTKPVGGIEAEADGIRTVIMAGAYFMGPEDSTGNIEIAFNP